MVHPSNAYPSLTKSYKGMFPFKLGTTSFIYPDHYIPNVKMLGPYLDEIELLLFECAQVDALPSKSVITELARLADEFDLNYNVHLPTDISISSPDPREQRYAVENMIRVMDLVAPLSPSGLILHIPYTDGSMEENIIKSWRSRVYDNLHEILLAGKQKDIVAVENLDYPFVLIEDIVVELGLKICLDLGHLMVYDYDILKTFNKYSSNTSIIHLHGVENDRDHRALDRLPENLTEAVLRILKKFTGIVSLEIFSFDNLVSSLNLIEKRWVD